MSTLTTAADYRDGVGQAYVIEIDIDGDGAADLLKLDLVECKDLTPHDFPGRQRDPFSLIFTGPVNMALPQGTYRMKREGTDAAQDIFLVPLGPSDDKMRYQAIFT